jgi:hypothetical protein
MQGFFNDLLSLLRDIIFYNPQQVYYDTVTVEEDEEGKR